MQRTNAGCGTDILMPSFIPQRDDSANIHASYQLIPDGPGSSLGYVPAIYPEHHASAAAALERSKRKGGHGEIDVMKGTSWFHAVGFPND